MKDAIRAKKEANKKWETSGRQDERYIYRETNKEAKKEVARSNAQTMDEQASNLTAAPRQFAAVPCRLAAMPCE